MRSATQEGRRAHADTPPSRGLQSQRRRTRPSNALRQSPVCQLSPTACAPASTCRRRVHSARVSASPTTAFSRLQPAVTTQTGAAAAVLPQGRVHAPATALSPPQPAPAWRQPWRDRCSPRRAAARRGGGPHALPAVATTQQRHGQPQAGKEGRLQSAFRHVRRTTLVLVCSSSGACLASSWPETAARLRCRRQ
jgi:hypothetical protein